MDTLPNFQITVDKNYNSNIFTDTRKVPRYQNLVTVGNEPGMEGDIIIDRDSNKLCYHDGEDWQCLEPSSTGPTGEIGDQGAQGPQGPQGIAGQPGNPGEIGVQGPQGPTGVTGAQGADGTQGPTGVTGAQGPASQTGIADAVLVTDGSSCNDSRTWVAITPNVTGTGDLILNQEGTTGALMRTIEDGTVVGGNCRGDYAVDFQITRTQSDQVAAGSYAVILNGTNNKVDAQNDYSTIINGADNLLNAGLSTIVAGDNNTIDAPGATYNTINSGSGNTINSTASPPQVEYAVINAGSGNSIDSGSYNVINSGLNTSIEGSDYAVIAQGSTNSITASDYAVLANGLSNTISNSANAVIINGNNNTVSNSANAAIVNSVTDTITDSPFSIIMSGDNSISTSDYSAVVSGQGNSVTNSNGGIIGGGLNNTISNSANAVILGGNTNQILNAQFGVIGTGNNNIVNAEYGIVVNGNNNVADAPYTTVMGTRGIAPNYGEYTVGVDTTIGSPPLRTQTTILHYIGGVVISDSSIATGVLYLDDLAAEQLDIDNCAWSLRINAVANQTLGSGDSCSALADQMIYPGAVTAASTVAAGSNNPAEINVTGLAFVYSAPDHVLQIELTSGPNGGGGYNVAATVFATRIEMP